MNKAVNAISSTLKGRSKDSDYWDRAWGSINKLSNRKPAKGAEQSFDNAIGKFHNALKSKNKDEFEGLLRPYVEAGRKKGGKL